MDTWDLLEKPQAAVDDLASACAPRTASAPPARAASCAAASLGEWVALVAMSQGRAMRWLHGALEAPVRRAVSAIVHDPYLADEVVGESFWQIWRDAARFDLSRGSVTTWAVTIARSRALDALRRRKTLASHEQPDDDEEPFAPSCDRPEALLETRQRDARLDAALARLDPIQRQLLALSFGAGMSHEQVAEHCGLALGTVKSHIRRGLVRMRGHCERVGLGP